MSDKLNPIGEFFKLIRQCPCGSDEPFSWEKDNGDKEIKVCKVCRNKLGQNTKENK